MKALSTMLFVCALASAEEFHRIEGTIISNSGNPQEVLWAKLSPTSLGVTADSPVSPDGRFGFPLVPQGVYMLRIVNGTGREVASQLITVQDMDQWLTVPLSGEAVSLGVRAPGAKVSVAVLRHKPEKGAQRAEAQAEKLAARGDHAGAAAGLEKAVALDPQFIRARGHLGVEYILLHQWARATEELRQAAALDPSEEWLLSNLAFALSHVGSSEEAEQWARKAVALDGGNARSHYVLGWILVQQPGKSAEGIQQLERAARDFPSAHRTLADYYRSAGDLALARREMERYLAADPTANRTEVEGWIKALR